MTIADALRNYIRSYLVAGDRLESGFHLAEALNADVADVQAARDELVADGILRCDEFVYVVTNTLPSDDIRNGSCQDDRHAQ